MAPRKKQSTPLGDSLTALTQAVAYRDGPFHRDLGFLAVYDRSWLARAAVGRLPEDCFKKAYQWIAEPAQISAIEALENKLRVKRKKQWAYTLSRLEGEAYIYMDLPGRPDTPARIDSLGRGQLRFINVLRRQDLTMGMLIQAPTSEWFGQPEYYDMNTENGMVRVHPSRVIRFVANQDIMTGWGRSVLEFLWKPICTAEETRDNVAALVHKARVFIMKIDGLSDAVSDPNDLAALVKRFELMETMLKTNALAIMDKTLEDFGQVTTSFATLPEVMETMRREVCAALEIPYALLFGRQGGLGNNGDVDLANYYDNVATIQSTELQPTCEPLDEAIIRSALGNRPPEIYLQWLSLWEMSDKEKSEITKAYTDSMVASVGAGLIPIDVASPMLIGQFAEIGSFPGIEQAYQEWIAGGGLLEQEETEDDIDREEPSPDLL